MVSKNTKQYLSMLFLGYCLHKNTMGKNIHRFLQNNIPSKLLQELHDTLPMQLKIYFGS